MCFKSQLSQLLPLLAEYVVDMLSHQTEPGEIRSTSPPHVHPPPPPNKKTKHHYGMLCGEPVWVLCPLDRGSLKNSEADSVSSVAEAELEIGASVTYSSAGRKARQTAG